MAVVTRSIDHGRPRFVFVFRFLPSHWLNAKRPPRGTHTHTLNSVKTKNSVKKRHNTSPKKKETPGTRTKKWRWIDLCSVSDIFQSIHVEWSMMMWCIDIYSVYRVFFRFLLSSNYVFLAKLGFTGFTGFTEFYRVLLGFTGFYRVFFRFLPSSNYVCLAKLGLTEFYRVLPSFTRVYWVLPGFTEFYRVFFRFLPSSNYVYLAKLGLTGFYRVLPSFLSVST